MLAVKFVLLVNSKLVKLSESLSRSRSVSTVDPKVIQPNRSVSFPLSAGLVKRGGKISSSPESMDGVDDPEDSGSAADGPKKLGPKSDVNLLSRRGSGNSRTSSPLLLPSWHMQANGREGEEQNRQNQIGSVYLLPLRCLMPTMMMMMPSRSGPCYLNSHRRRQLTRYQLVNAYGL